MSMLQAFMAALLDRQTGQLDPLRVAKMLGSAASAVDQFKDPHTQALVTHLIGPWALSVAKMAPQKWTLPTNLAPSCCLEVGSHLCGAFAISGCHLCGRPICIGHALINVDATLVCWSCMREAAKHVKKWKAPGGAQDSNALQWAYDLLGLEVDCTLQQAKTAYKQRVAKFHPDTVGGGQDSKAHGDLVRLLKRAYDAIVESRQDNP